MATTPPFVFGPNISNRLAPSNEPFRQLVSGMRPGKYPYREPLYVKVGFVTGVNNWLVEVTFDDGQQSPWIAFDETTKGRMIVGQPIDVTFMDQACTRPYPLIASGSRGAYHLDVRL